MNEKILFQTGQQVWLRSPFSAGLGSGNIVSPLPALASTALIPTMILKYDRQ